MGELSRELLTGRGRFTLPVDSLCLELQAIADAFHEAGGSVRVKIPLGFPHDTSSKSVWLGTALIRRSDERGIIESNPSTLAYSFRLVKGHAAGSI